MVFDRGQIRPAVKMHFKTYISFAHKMTQYIFYENMLTPTFNFIWHFQEPKALIL